MTSRRACPSCTAGSRRCSAPSSSSYEIVLVDDGSHDRTWELIKELAARDARVKGLSFSRNFGHQMAFTAGLDHVDGDAVVIMDADLQDPPELIPELVARWREGYDVVYAVRAKRHGETAFKLLTAAAFYRLLHAITNVEIPVDTGDFRLMSRKAVAAFRRFSEHHRFTRGMVVVARLPADRRALRAGAAPRRGDQVPVAQDAPPRERRHHLVLLSSRCSSRPGSGSPSPGSPARRWWSTLAMKAAGSLLAVGLGRRSPVSLSSAGCS